MSTTKARRGGWVQHEQSDMHLALCMAKMAKGGILCNSIKEMQHLIMKPRAQIQDEKKQGVECPGHRQLKPAIE